MVYKIYYIIPCSGVNMLVVVPWIAFVSFWRFDHMVDINSKNELCIYIYIHSEGYLISIPHFVPMLSHRGSGCQGVPPCQHSFFFHPVCNIHCFLQALTHTVGNVPTDAKTQSIYIYIYTHNIYIVNIYIYIYTYETNM